MEKASDIFSKSSYWANFFRTNTSKDDIETLLLSMPPFAHLDQKHLRILIKLLHNRVYAPNEYLFLQGDPGVGLYIIKEGEVQIIQDTGEGNKLELAKFCKGDFLGEIALLDDEPRSGSAIALKETQIVVIFKPDLDEFIEKYPKFGIGILKGISVIVSTRLRILNDDFFSLYNKYKNLSEELKDGND
jgi:CRP-like cAMP-binding protein